MRSTLGWFVLAIVVGSAMPVYAASKITLVIAKNAPPLEQLAATELSAQLKRLCDAEVVAAETLPATGDVILLGSPQTNPVIKNTAFAWPKLSEQGHLLKSIKMGERTGLVVGGSSPTATLWAAYELSYQHGLRYLLFGDVYPADATPLRLSGFDLVFEPTVRQRGFRVLTPGVMGTELWSLAEHQRLIGQLAKLKFNLIVAEPLCWQPFVDFQFAGIQRSTAELNFGIKLNIAATDAGKAVFKGAKEFTNPDFVGKATYAERMAAGTTLLRGVIDAAQDRGMQTTLVMDSSEFTPEFKGQLKHDAQFNNELRIVAGPSDERTAANAARWSAALRHYPKLNSMDRFAGPTGALAMPSVIPITLNPDTILSSADSSLSKESKLLVDITTVNGANPTLPAVARAAFGVRLTPENAYRELLLPTSGADGATRMIKSYESMAQASDLIRKHDMTITTPSPQMVLKHFSDNGAPTSTVPSWWKEAKDAYIAAMNEFYRGNQQARAADKPFARYGAKKCESAMHYFNCLEAVKLAGIAHRQGEKDAAIEQLEKAIESLYFCIDNLREIARDPNDVGIIAALNEFGYRPLQKQLQKLQDE